MCLLTPSSAFQSHKIYIQNIPPSQNDTLTEQILLDFFRSFGQVVDVKLLKNSLLISPQQTVRLRLVP